ncbi:MAG: hypothetical protein KAI72_03505 [Candidatus Pacebacteria bacterium]|nr:hypothetical protein [Candidatus Paceibacterota bacterium]
MLRFILPITFIFFAVSLYFSYIGPSFDKIEAANVEITSLNETLSKNKGEIEDRLNDLEEQWNSISTDDKEKLYRLVPNKSDFNEAAFINDMNNIASLHNMRLDGVGFSNQSELTSDSSEDSEDAEDFSGNFGVFTMSFNVEGTYHKFIEFLKDIERSEQLIDVNVTSFNSTDTGLYNYGVSLVTYWLN